MLLFNHADGLIQPYTSHYSLNWGGKPYNKVTQCLSFFVSKGTGQYFIDILKNSPVCVACHLTCSPSLSACRSVLSLQVSLKINVQNAGPALTAALLEQHRVFGKFTTLAGMPGWAEIDGASKKRRDTRASQLACLVWSLGAVLKACACKRSRPP